MNNQPDQGDGTCVLGIDAAWTAHQPSGIALVQHTRAGWSCLGLAPSYDSFLAQASGQGWNPEQKATGSKPDPAALLHASHQLADGPISWAPTSPRMATPFTPAAAIWTPVPPESSMTSERATRESRLHNET